MSSQDHFLLPARKRSDFKAAVARWQGLERAPGVSLATRQWLMQATDPFHDTPLKAVGYPSGANDSSVVHEVTRSITITKPADLASGNWDCHIITNNVAGHTNAENIIGFDAAFNQIARVGGQGMGTVGTVFGEQLTCTTAAVAPFAACPILINRVPSGNSTFSSAPTTANLAFGAIDIPPQYLKGPHRVVGMGFEVVNTTESLYRNGAVTVYRVPSRITDSVLNVESSMPSGTPGYNTDGSFQANSAAAQRCNQALRTYGSIIPPQNSSAASLAHGSATWDASEGAYVIASFESPPEILNQRSAMHYWYSADTDPLTPSTVYCMGPGVVAGTPGVAPTQQVVVGQQSSNSANWNGGAPSTTSEGQPLQTGTSLIPISRSGAYFTGLSNQSSLKLTVRFFIERIPPLSEPDIYTLAARAPSYAPELWELYTKVVEDLPPGVMFTENPLGEWFKKVASTVAKYAPAIGTTLGNMGVPGAQMIGSALGQVGKGVGEFMSPHKPAPKRPVPTVKPPVPPRPAKKVAAKK